MKWSKDVRIIRHHIEQRGRQEKDHLTNHQKFPQFEVPKQNHSSIWFDGPSGYVAGTCCALTIAKHAYEASSDSPVSVLVLLSELCTWARLLRNSQAMSAHL